MISIEEKELLDERINLAFNRIVEIANEKMEIEGFGEYFNKTAKLIILIKDTKEFIEKGGLDTASYDELKHMNHSLFEDILPENYDTCFGNPAYADEKLGEDYGKLLSFLYAEIRSMIGFVFEGKLEEIAIRAELFNEIYAAFSYEISEENKLPSPESIKQILYWFVSDYADVAAENKIREQVTEADKFAKNIILHSDLSDARYLFKYGEYISENELKIADFLAKLPKETIDTMADTYTEGYVKGFELAGIDLGKKEIVELIYPIGFERMMRKAVHNFEKIHLFPAVSRNPVSILYNPSIYKRGFSSTSANRQYEFDHRNDQALFFDKNLSNRRLEVIKTAAEKYKADALKYAGPAVVETFGEATFDPVNKPQSAKFSDEQNKLMVEYRNLSGELMRNYIIQEERSFTIIAFPIPEIGDNFEEIFSETIRINTLDYKLYQRIQQTIIDTLNTAVKCEIKGYNGNHTDLTVQLYQLNNPDKETIFENCVADVNIPVGEVFTSPVLEGTEGVLYVSKVFLNGLEFRDLDITFKDGKITDYSCSNFKTVAENKAFISENILFRHETLPLGEFAIGTNTTAYTVSRKYDLADKLPILIAEKTGPHFAVGDTCYSHSENVRVFNPDGKEIVAKDNSCSLLRDKDVSKAYFNCHTDITIPYDELGELTAIRSDGSRVPIIVEGRFVLPGTEELNAAFEE